MKIEQIYTGCLAHGAYYIESDGEAAIIDPLREIQPYIERAKKDNARIVYVFETHFHADFVSGHLDLARASGARIVFGPTAKPGFEAHVAKDGEVFKIGSISIELIHTPGHTMESSCYLLRNEEDKSVALFTGDTLFIGDVGRPDLAQKVKADLTPEKLAGYLYDSLREKIMPLPDDIVVYPAHGAGSACGKKMSSETVDTLGHQKAVNYALNPRLNKAAFVKEVLSGLMPPPGYFPANVMMNIKGYEQITEVIHRGTQALSPEAFEAAANETGALIIDTRDASQFAKSFIPNSINIGLDGSFAPWVGTLLPDIKQPILFVCDEGREEEVVTRLARVGYDNAIGYLKGGMAAWQKAGRETDKIQSIEAGQLAEILKEHPQTAILDVRRQSEYDSEHIVSAINAPLDYLNDSMLLLDKQKTYYVHCAGGYRSMIFISALRARGYKHLINVEGGMNEIKAVNQFSLTDYVQPRSLL